MNKRGREQLTHSCPEKKIVLARHGETMSNRDALIMGRTDSELTPESATIAKRLAGIIEKEQVQAVYSRDSLARMAREMVSLIIRGEWQWAAPGSYMWLMQTIIGCRCLTQAVLFSMQLALPAQVMVSLTCHRG